MSTGRSEITAQGLREISVVQKEALGTLTEARDGSLYVYGQAGASNLSAGSLSVAEAKVSGHTNQTVYAAAAVGSKKVQLNTTSTAVTADQYADGYLVVNDATGEGIAYQIAGNGAASGGSPVTIQLYDPITVALVASTSEASLIKHPAKTVIESTTLSKAVGVPNVAVTAAYFAWFQKTGICSVLADGTPTKGYNLVQSNGTAGAVEVFTDSTAGATDLQEIVGVAMETFVSTEHPAASLSIR